MKQTRLPQDERREQIIKTSMQIINEEGYAAFTTRRLAEKIGISEPALYRHFNNKDDIVISILLKMNELWSDLESEQEKVTDIEEKLCLFITMHFRYIEKNPDILAVLFADEYLRLNENVKGELQKTINNRYNYLEKLLNEASKEGIIIGDSVKALTIIIIGTIRMTVHNWRNSNYSFSLTKIGEEVCNTLVSMILCDKRTKK